VRFARVFFREIKAQDNQNGPVNREAVFPMAVAGSSKNTDTGHPSMARLLSPR
jgi:hypothetical protein